MAKTVGPLVDEVLLRLRDTSAVGTSRAIARRALAYAVGYTALAYNDTLVTFTLTTERERLLYDLSETSDRIVRVVRVTDTNGHEVPLSQTVVIDGLFDPHWFRAQGDQFTHFAQLGKRLLVLWPAVDRAESVTLHCKAFPTIFTADTETVGIEDDLVPQALALAETLLLVRAHRPDRLRTNLANLIRAFNIPVKATQT